MNYSIERKLVRLDIIYWVKCWDTYRLFATIKNAVRYTGVTEDKVIRLKLTKIEDYE